MIYKKKEDVKDFIRCNSDCTIQEIAAELGCNESRIKELAAELNIILPTTKQRNIDYIRFNPGKTVEYYAAKLDVSVKCVEGYLKELSINPVRAKEVDPTKTDVAASYPKENEDGLMKVWAEMMEGATKEECEKFAQLFW